MKRLTIVIDDYSTECLYIDGRAWPDKGECTVYAGDLVEAAGGKACKIEHVEVEPVDQWPDNLADLQRTDGKPWPKTIREAAQRKEGEIGSPDRPWAPPQPDPLATHPQEKDHD
jgi:hypothetical protein